MMLGSDARAGVTYVDAHGVFHLAAFPPFHVEQKFSLRFPPLPETGRHAYHHKTFRGSMFERVLNQVGNDVLQLERLNPHSFSAFSRAKLVADALLRCRRR